MKSITLAAVFFLVCASLGCTAITNFDDVDEYYSIADNLQMPVSITLTEDTGSVALTFDSALPTADGDNANLEQLLTDGTVDVTVVNLEDAAGTVYSLSQGTLVDGTPSSVGEYNATINAERDSISVFFYNEFNGHSLSADKQYKVTIGVTANDYFKVETIDVQTDDVSIITN